MEDGTAASAAYRNIRRQFPLAQIIPFSSRTATSFLELCKFFSALFYSKHNRMKQCDLTMLGYIVVGLAEIFPSRLGNAQADYILSSIKIKKDRFPIEYARTSNFVVSRRQVIKSYFTVPEDQFNFNLWQILIEGFQSHLILMFQRLVKLTVPVHLPGLHVVGFKPLLTEM